MMTTTSFKVDSDNIELVVEMAKTRELSKILNFLLREYAKAQGFTSSYNKIQALEDKLTKKDAQYEALKKEVLE
ncbi:MAG: hypothetical protein AMDU2_EPLC00007G0083 [Thermoplasmatales archaeon E-plasma]|nr:MAG: hypothetical protein AMDU2_EPLC00007G0083 [Thermoplasmatales archaeon E-plasma]